MSKKGFGLALVLLLVVSATASAQWRGLGRASGKVVDDSGAPVANVTVRADLPGRGGTTIQTNEKGEWLLGGIARGEWNLTFAKDGMGLVKTKVVVQEMAAPAAVNTTLKKQ